MADIQYGSRNFLLPPNTSLSEYLINRYKNSLRIYEGVDEDFIDSKWQSWRKSRPNELDIENDIPIQWKRKALVFKWVLYDTDSTGITITYVKEKLGKLRFSIRTTGYKLDECREFAKFIIWVEKEIENEQIL